MCLPEDYLLRSFPLLSVLHGHLWEGLWGGFPCRGLSSSFFVGSIRDCLKVEQSQFFICWTRGWVFFPCSYISSLRSLLVAYECTPLPQSPLFFLWRWGMLYFLVTGTEIMCQIVWLWSLDLPLLFQDSGIPVSFSLDLMASCHLLFFCRWWSLTQVICFLRLLPRLVSLVKESRELLSVRERHLICLEVQAPTTPAPP